MAYQDDLPCGDTDEGEQRWSQGLNGFEEPIRSDVSERKAAAVPQTHNLFLLASKAERGRTISKEANQQPLIHPPLVCISMVELDISLSHW